MNAEKPLNVRVAEALGVEPAFRDFPSEDYCVLQCSCGAMHEFGHSSAQEEDRAWREKHQPHLTQNWNCPRYDIDWSTTGPLIDRFKITLQWDGLGWHACEMDAHRGVEGTSEPWHDGLYADGETSLEAVCNLILQLHAAGKLR